MIVVDSAAFDYVIDGVLELALNVVEDLRSFQGGSYMSPF